MSVSVNDILEDVDNNRLFGIIEVDIHVPAHLHQHFAEYCSFFLNSTVEKRHLSPLIQQHVRNFLNNNFTSRRTLLSVMVAKHHFIITPLLKFYRQHGLVIDHVHQVSQYTPQPRFQPFL